MNVTITKENKISLGFGALTLLFTGLIVTFLPVEQRELKSLWVFLVKLMPFICATICISTLNQDFVRRYKIDFAFHGIIFLAYWCVFVPKIFFYMGNHSKLYTTIQLLTPFLILSFILFYRMGGGSTSRVLRIGFALLALMLSGLEDLCYIIVNNHPETSRYATIPEVWDWASHMTVRLGHPASKYEAFGFIISHVTFAIFLVFFPFQKFFQRISLMKARSEQRDCVQ